MEVRTFQINEEWDDCSWGKAGWFEASIEAYLDQAPSIKMSDYDYIQIVPLSNYKQFPFGNDGAQAFRERETGWTFPDHCRQVGGCPEIWHTSKKHNLSISTDSPVWDYILEY